MKIVPIIISGGVGTRLWPLSTKESPKQFHGFLSGKSLLKETVERVLNLELGCSPIFITQEKYRFHVLDQIKNYCKDSKVILEPHGKNTAPAFAVASQYVKTNFPDSIAVVFPSDHLIVNIKAFKDSIEKGVESAERNKIVIFGVKPTKIHTGYGYIKKGEKNKHNSFEINSFHEKPDYEIAKSFSEDKSFFWNSGIYMFKPDIILKELSKKHSSIVINSISSLDNLKTDGNFLRLDEKEFMKNEEVSIDLAIMEQTKQSVLVELSSDWNDLGSWDSIYDESKKDSDKNALEGDIFVQETTGSYIRSNKRKVIAIGLEDLLIVDTEHDLLVASRSKINYIKSISQEINKGENKERLTKRRKFRPWGSFKILDEGEKFLVKKITVNINSKLSLQRHQHRAENWVVVKGKAKVTCNEEVSILEKDRSIYIPKGSKHRLENIGDTELEVVEVQSGDYLSEDDIERFEDDYNR